MKLCFALDGAARQDGTGRRETGAASGDGRPQEATRRAGKGAERLDGLANIYNPDMDVEKLPRLQIESIEVEGPIQKEWPPASHKALFFAADKRQDEAYVREIFARFLPRAYRRPVTHDGDRGDRRGREGRADDRQALVPRCDADRLAARAVRAGFSLPARAGRRPSRSPGLSPIMSWRRGCRTSSGARCRTTSCSTLAAAGKLHDPAVVAAQVKRMLADPKAEQLVQNFAGQWLSVRNYGSVQPAAEYKDYDKLLEQASKQEPFAFFAEVLGQEPADHVVHRQRLRGRQRTAGETLRHRRRRRGRSSAGWRFGRSIIAAACWAWRG